MKNKPHFPVNNFFLFVMKWGLDSVWTLLSVIIYYLVVYVRFWCVCITLQAKSSCTRRLTVQTGVVVCSLICRWHTDIQNHVNQRQSRSMLQESPNLQVLDVKVLLGRQWLIPESGAGSAWTVVQVSIQPQAKVSPGHPQVDVSQWQSHLRHTNHMHIQRELTCPRLFGESPCSLSQSRSFLHSTGKPGRKEALCMKHFKLQCKTQDREYRLMYVLWSDWSVYIP